MCKDAKDQIEAINAQAVVLNEAAVSLNLSIEQSKRSVGSLAEGVSQKLKEHDDHMDAARGFQKRLQDYKVHLQPQSLEQLEASTQKYIQQAKEMDESARELLQHAEARMQPMARGDCGMVQQRDVKLNNPKGFNFETIKDHVANADVHAWFARFHLHADQLEDWNVWGRVLRK